jgi:hypothetical protein
MSTATCAPPAAAGTLRQQLLFLYLSHPNPTAETVGWSLFDGTGRETRQSGDSDQPPYASVVAAMCDGWRVIQVAQQRPPYPGAEERTSYLPYEFVLERLIDLGRKETSHE